MKPAPFDYLRPDGLDTALAALAADPEAAALAGGQSLLAMMNMRAARPTMLVDLSGLSELRGVAEDGAGLRIGALTTHATLETDPSIAAGAPLLQLAARELAHPAIRNRGAIGGSLALADPAAELPAVVAALDGTIEIAGLDGQREIAADDFFLGAYETALAPGELIVAVRIPSAVKRVAYRKLARRHGDYAMVGLAAAWPRDDSPRIAYFAVDDAPTLAEGASRALAAGDIDAAVAALAHDLTPIDHPDCDAATKLHLAGVLLRRAYLELGE